MHTSNSSGTSLNDASAMLARTAKTAAGTRWRTVVREVTVRAVTDTDVYATVLEITPAHSLSHSFHYGLLTPY